MGKKLQHVQESYDPATGEVKILSKTFSVKSKSTEEFYISFLSGLNAICNLTRSGDIKLLALLCVRAEFNTGVVKLSSNDRKELMEKLDCATNVISNSIGRLKKAGLLSGDRGDYEINPHCFWKGTTDERNRLLKDKKMDIHFKFGMGDDKG